MDGGTICFHREPRKVRIICPQNTQNKQKSLAAVARNADDIVINMDGE